MKNKLQQFIQFLKEAYIELQKVSWLTKKEVFASTLVVIVFILIVAVYVGLVDFILGWVIGIFLGGRR